MKVGEGLAISREGDLSRTRDASRGDVARGGDVMNNNIISHRSRGRDGRAPPTSARVDGASDGSAADG